MSEIRRFWPWVKATDHFGMRGFWSTTHRGVQVVAAFYKPFGQFPERWDVSFFDDRSRRRSKSAPWIGNGFFGPPDGRGPTIAAAMAAAGFAQRPKGLFADYRYLTAAVWIETAKRNPERFAGRTRIPLESRQRPRKGVRLGTRQRRAALALSFAKARLLVAHRRGKSTFPAQYNALLAQQRLDRGEIGG